MSRKSVVILAAGAIALSGCQTTGPRPDFVKQGNGPAIEVATERCKAYAAKARHLVIGVGSVEAAAFGLLATLAATASARTHAFRNCMAAHGYVRNDGRAAPVAVSPAATPAGGPGPAPRKPSGTQDVQRAG